MIDFLLGVATIIATLMIATLAVGVVILAYDEIKDRKDENGDDNDSGSPS